MASNDQADDVATYAASVRAALSNLPTDQSDVLLEDLEDHLREVAAEAEGPLGAPESSAGEGRTYAGDRRQCPDRPHRRARPGQHGHLSPVHDGRIGWFRPSRPTTLYAKWGGDQHLSLLA